MHFDTFCIFSVQYFTLTRELLKMFAAVFVVVVVVVVEMNTGILCETPSEQSKAFEA